MKALDALSGMWAKVAEARVKNLPSTDRPQDSFTAEEYANKFGLTGAAARAQLHRLIGSGVFAKHRVMNVAADGRNCAMNVYTVATK